MLAASFALRKCSGVAPAPGVSPSVASHRPSRRRRRAGLGLSSSTDDGRELQPGRADCHGPVNWSDPGNTVGQNASAVTWRFCGDWCKIWVVTTTRSTFRFSLFTTAALWLAVVGTGVSMTHSHDDEPGPPSPHRHLILFGVECPAETPGDGDAPGQWQAPVDPPGDPVGPSAGAFVALLCPPIVDSPIARPRVAGNSPSTPSGHFSSPHAIRSAILRA